MFFVYIYYLIVWSLLFWFDRVTWANDFQGAHWGLIKLPYRGPGDCTRVNISQTWPLGLGDDRVSIERHGFISLCLLEFPKTCYCFSFAFELFY